MTTTTVPQIHHVTLVLKDKTIQANWLGRFGGTDFVYLRYWINNPITGQSKPVQITATHCPVHQICFLHTDFPDGCPECKNERG